MAQKYDSPMLFQKQNQHPFLQDNVCAQALRVRHEKLHPPAEIRRDLGRLGLHLQTQLP